MPRSERLESHPPVVEPTTVGGASPREVETAATRMAPPNAASNDHDSGLRQAPRRREPPPEPLLSRTNPVSPFADAPAAPWSDPQSRQPEQPAIPVRQAATAEPDIHIHIGRIELRADPPEPAKPKRPARERRIASLDDYLKGGKA